MGLNHVSLLGAGAAGLPSFSQHTVLEHLLWARNWDGIAHGALRRSPSVHKDN